MSAEYFYFPLDARDEILRLLTFLAHQEGEVVEWEPIEGQAVFGIYAVKEPANVRPFPPEPKLTDKPLPDEEKKRAVWVKRTFTIDDQNDLVGYHIPGNTWNGWQTPAFEKDELIRWLTIEIPGHEFPYDPEKDTIRIPEEGNDPDHQFAVGFDVMTENGPKHLYTPDGWTWDLASSAPDDPCDCGHTREAHINGGEGRCGLCECHKFRGLQDA